MIDISTDAELTAETTSIHGFWLDLGSRVVKDSGWIRIEWLLDHRLELIKAGNRDVGSLYRNPQDDSLWHYRLVAPHMQEGGPPSLERIGRAEAMTLFDLQHNTLYRE